MDELEQTLDRVLSDPKEMEKITRLASRLLGGEGGEEEKTGKSPASESGAMAPGKDKAALLRALSPYLREDRRKRLKKALRLARAVGMAETMMETLGGEERV